MSEHDRENVSPEQPAVAQGGEQEGSSAPGIGLLGMAAPVGGNSVARAFARRVMLRRNKRNDTGSDGHTDASSLSLSQPSDAHELEAEHVAARVVRGQALERPPSQSGAGVSRQVESGGGRGHLDEPVSDGIAAARGGGQPLDGAVRAPMEHALQSDFGQVKVHTDSASDTLSQSLGARAFTTGTDIFFKQGQYQPGTAAGQHVLAHELTHVAQGTGNAIHRMTDMAQLASTEAPAEHQKEGQHESIKGVIDARDAASALDGKPIVRDANYNNLRKRVFEEKLANLIFKNIELVAMDTVLTVSKQMYFYILKREQLHIKTIEESLAQLAPDPGTLGAKSFDPRAADFTPESGIAVLKGEKKASLPAHLNIHGKFAFALYMGDLKTDKAQQIAAEIEMAYASSLNADKSLKLMPDALFGAANRPRKNSPMQANPPLVPHMSGLAPMPMTGAHPPQPDPGHIQELPVASMSEINGRPSDGKQPHKRGMDLFMIDESKKWAQKARLALDMPLSAGPSGSAALMLTGAREMGLGGGEELLEYAAALIASVAGGGHHTFHEIMTVAALAGVPYVEGNYRGVYPASLTKSQDFKNLVIEYPDLLG